MYTTKTQFLKFLLILALTFMFACKKDLISPYTTKNAHDTIFPLSYFPVYPASYWKYVDSNNDTSIINVDPFYKKDCYTYGSIAFMSDTFFVPVYNNIPIWGYEAHTGPISHSGSYPLTRIVSDSLSVGSYWDIYLWGGTGISRKIIAKDTTISISGISYYPTIVVEEYYSDGPPYYVWIAKRYYTKNIGLIREDNYNASDSTVNTKVLIDYFINK